MDGLAGSEKIILNCKKKSETYQLFPNHSKNYLFMTRETEKKVFLETKNTTISGDEPYLGI